MRPATRVGVVGLGKVGLALALVMRHYGKHSVIGWDTSIAAVGRAQTHPYDLHPEQEMRELLEAGTIPLAPDLEAFVEHSDIIFICVQTPHSAIYDGTTPMTNRVPVDFDYGPARDALLALAPKIGQIGKPKTVVMVSTVSPGTTRELMQNMPALVSWAYQPVFISLGRVVQDLLTPDYILVGTNNNGVYERLCDLWTPITNTRPILGMIPESAELAKLALNATISMQICWVNQLAALSDVVGANVDDVVSLLNGTRRLRLHPTAGMGDGGACRPRDTIVLDRLCLDHHIMPSIPRLLTIQREEHSAWLAQMVARHQQGRDLPAIILGRAYRPDVPYEDGSPSLLLANDLRRIGIDAMVTDQVPDYPAVFVLAHSRFAGYTFPAGSIVIDPWGATQHAPINATATRPGRQA